LSESYLFAAKNAPHLATHLHTDFQIFWVLDVVWKRAFQNENTYLLITLLEFCLDALLGTPFDNICASITSVPLAFVLIFEALKSNLNCANLK